MIAYETSARLAADNQNSRLDFDYGPAKRLVSIYVRDKRLEDARRILVDGPEERRTISMSYPDGYLEQMRMQSLGSAAGELLKLGFAADAATLYNESIALAKDIPADAPNYIGNREGLLRQHRDGLTRALDELKPEDLAASLTRMIASSETATPRKPPIRTRLLPRRRRATRCWTWWCWCILASSTRRRSEACWPTRSRPLAAGRRPTS